MDTALEAPVTEGESVAVAVGYPETDPGETDAEVPLEAVVVDSPVPEVALGPSGDEEEDEDEPVSVGGSGPLVGSVPEVEVADALGDELDGGALEEEPEPDPEPPAGTAGPTSGCLPERGVVERPHGVASLVRVVP